MKKNEVLVCNHCQTMQTVQIKKPNHILHLIMSVITMGFWLIIYAFAAIEAWGAPAPKCHNCKRKIK